MELNALMRKDLTYRFSTAQVHQAAVDLEVAARKMETLEWVQGRNFNLRTSSVPVGCCAFGGLMLATHEWGTSLTEYDSRVNIAACSFAAVAGYDIVSFNDNPDRTKTEVLAKMRQVAATLRTF